jgi:predicted TIM-barrel fold metal-dependent hydrolase
VAVENPVYGVGQTLGWQMPPEDPRKLGAIWLRELDRHGVSRAAVIASIPGDEDSVCEAAGESPDRLLPYAMFNPLAPDALIRVEKALRAGLKGLCFFPAMHRYSIQDERVHVLLEAAAAAANVAVFVHCGVLTVGVRDKLGLPSQFDLRFSNPADLHAVALRFPSLPFVIPHFGAGYFREALMVCDLCPNVHLDTSSTNSWTRYEGLNLRDVFRRAMEIAGVKRLLFGSDSSYFPRGWNGAIFETQARVVYELGASAEDAALIFGGNLENLLKS